MPARSLPHKRQIIISLVIFFTMALVITVGDYVTAQKTVLRESQNYAEKIASHISTLLFVYTASHGENPPINEIPDDLRGYMAEIKHIMTDFNLFNVKVFNKQGKILFSMDPEVIGRTVEDHGGFEQAMTGKSTSFVATSSSHEKKYGSGSPFSMLETYVPVYHPDTGEIAGVYEIYQDYRPLAATVRVETFRSSFTHIVLLLIFATLFFRYGSMTSRLLEEEQERMINDLEDRVEERTLELKRSRNRIDDLLKRTEEMYRELKISDEYQKNFIGLVSHELRTPLTVVKGYLSLLKEGILRIGEPETSEAIETSLNEAKHLESIIENIIELTQLEQGIKYITRDEIDIADILNESIKMLEREIEERQVEVVVKISQGAETCHSDRISILHVLNQLLSNAIKFSQVGGKVDLYAAPSHRGLFFSVTDQGVGIPKAQQEEIFNRFYQVDVSSTRSFEGSGLGLAIVKKISKLLGGRVWVETTEGAGSTFHFEVPDMPDAKPGTTQQEPGFPLSKEVPVSSVSRPSRVMVIDDDPDYLELIHTVLEGEGFEVVLCKEGLEALDYIFSGEQKALPDIILLDMRMPNIHGVDICHIVRRNVNTRDIPIIIISAFAQEEDIKDGLKSGANAYMTKPFDTEELLNRLEFYIKK